MRFRTARATRATAGYSAEQWQDYLRGSAIRENVDPQVIGWSVTELIEDSGGLHQVAEDSATEDFASPGVEAGVRNQLHGRITNEQIRNLPQTRSGFTPASDRQFQEIFLSKFPPIRFVGLFSCSARTIAPSTTIEVGSGVSFGALVAGPQSG